MPLYTAVGLIVYLYFTAGRRAVSLHGSTQRRDVSQRERVQLGSETNTAGTSRNYFLFYHLRLLLSVKMSNVPSHGTLLGFCLFLSLVCALSNRPRLGRRMLAFHRSAHYYYVRLCWLQDVQQVRISPCLVFVDRAVRSIPRANDHIPFNNRIIMSLQRTRSNTTNMRQGEIRIYAAHRTTDTRLGINSMLSEG